MSDIFSFAAHPNLHECFGRLVAVYGAHIDERKFLAGPLMQEIEVCESNATEWEYGLEEIYCSIGMQGYFKMDDAIKEIAEIGLLNPRLIIDRQDCYEIHGIVDMDGNKLAQVAIDRSGHDPEIAGYYLGSALHISKQHRSRGLGKSLIIAQALDLGALDVWWFGVSAFSPAGLEAHKAAFRDLSQAWVAAEEPALLAA